MKKTTLMLFAAAALVSMGTACKKEHQAPEAGRRAVTAGPYTLCQDTVGKVTLTGVLTNRTLSSDTVYYLSGLVYVTGNITIEPGTFVRGLPGSAGNPGGGLIVTKSGFIDARGTETCPIIFTSAKHGTGANAPAPGDWAGVVILGEATHNKGNGSIIEGISSNPPADATYGGNNDADNSGYLHYVRIEYAGYELNTDNELNGLTLGAVGSGTSIHHVEVYKANDDAFEFFGGTVNASYLIAIDPLDDMFDFDNGYRGTIDYALGVSDPNRADKSQSNGIELDNHSTGDSLKPITRPVLNHFTIVGQPSAAAASITNGAPSSTGRYGRTAHLRRAGAFNISNSVFLGLNYGLSIDSVASVSTAKWGISQYWYTLGVSSLSNNAVHAYVLPYAQERNGAAYYAFTPAAGNTAYTTSNPNANILLLDPFGRFDLHDFEAVTGGAAQLKGAGAVPVGATWVDTWTIY
ncbi:hypothetical protein MKQ68_01515 [Chitinophaga horti]|uniref:T9SS C-terminal target domain-containing protein n=1 Tax=Chitinophaga horti TaxID=2920382 RepID=A0ABY6J274_9BACT|nr:hypothetical protein [Chitinophaga horti]UYQ93773.1 hypothetical protein MKQ68_01515 [Chitinophaga horti]